MRNYQFGPRITKSKLTSKNQKLWLYHGGKENGKEIAVYMNCKLLEKVKELKYFGIFWTTN